MYFIFGFNFIHLRRFVKSDITSIRDIPVQYYTIVIISICAMMFCMAMGKIIIPHIFRHRRPELLILDNTISISNILESKYKCFEEYADNSSEDICDQISEVRYRVDNLKAELKKLQDMIR